MLIPISGKPGDLDLSNIKTVADADRVLLWLSAVLKDMATQVTDQTDPDPEWLRRLRAAQRATTNRRHHVLEIRDSLYGKMSAHEAVCAAAAEILEDEVLARLTLWIEKNSPHLVGIDIKALAKDQPA